MQSLQSGVSLKEVDGSLREQFSRIALPDGTVLPCLYFSFYFYDITMDRFHGMMMTKSLFCQNIDISVAALLQQILDKYDKYQ